MQQRAVLPKELLTSKKQQEGKALLERLRPSSLHMHFPSCVYKAGRFYLATVQILGKGGLWFGPGSEHQDFEAPCTAICM